MLFVNTFFDKDEPGFCTARWSGIDGGLHGSIVALTVLGNNGIIEACIGLYPAHRSKSDLRSLECIPAAVGNGTGW